MLIEAVFAVISAVVADFRVSKCHRADFVFAGQVGEYGEKRGFCAGFQFILSASESNRSSRLW